MEVNENQIRQMVKHILKEYANHNDADAYSQLEEYVNKIDEINSLLIGNDEINDIVFELRQIIQNHAMN